MIPVDKMIIFMTRSNDNISEAISLYVCFQGKSVALEGSCQSMVSGPCYDIEKKTKNLPSYFFSLHYNHIGICGL